MTTTITPPSLLLTWLDVERLLKKKTHLWRQMPECITAVDCFDEGMDIYYNGDDSQVDEWLTEIFGRFYLRDERQIQLQIAHARYPVTLIMDEGKSDISVSGYPLWQDVVYLPDEEAHSSDSSMAENPLNRMDMKNAIPVPFQTGPDLVSFHSFKGGVGRTSALMTYVAACFKAENGRQRKKILVIDADLEAPGVSFWIENAHKPKVSFVKLLEALHYSPAGVESALRYFADELKKTSFSVSGLNRELFVLPAALSLGEIQDMPVTPEHLARNPDNPWQLSDYLHKLGQLLEADAVFIDLRAGLSELASPILFDPRIDHFFVTTVAPQSVMGMAEVLRRLHACNSRLEESGQCRARPSVILSLLTRELRDSRYYQEALKQLGEAYPGGDPLDQQIQWLEADFNNTLMSIGSISEALERLTEAHPLYYDARNWAQALYTVQPIAQPNDGGAAGSNSERRKSLARDLFNICNKATFAESTELGHLLVTEPLLNLGKHFSRDVPNALIIGAKGAGKTFTFRQLVQSRNWQSFLDKLGFSPTDVHDAAIFPVLWSDNISDKPEGEIKTAQRSALQRLGLTGDALLTASQLKRKIEEALKKPPEFWDDFWDDLIASQFGLKSGGLVAMNGLLRSKEQRIVLAIDGIEDIFDDAGQEPANKAIESLLKLPGRLSELAEPQLGVIVFVRFDYVQDVIRQNLGQLLSRYEPFRLHWNAESFLRLAYMLSCQAGIYSEPRQPESMGLEELKIELQQLWGKKLGTEKSKEAYSARWVYAALCDLKGNVQARDLVRFLKFAAEIEQGRTGQTWADRLLAPESMRKSISKCSNEKVNEAKAEISVLRKWIDEMNSKGLRNIKVPFSAEQAGLDQKMLEALQEIGVIYEDTDSRHGEERLYVPEIYRHGLGFETSAAGRPRTQALLKKNIGTIPL